MDVCNDAEIGTKLSLREHGRALLYRNRAAVDVPGEESVGKIGGLMYEKIENEKRNAKLVDDFLVRRFNELFIDLITPYYVGNH